jgi:hypothetical protein
MSAQRECARVSRGALCSVPHGGMSLTAVAGRLQRGLVMAMIHELALAELEAHVNWPLPD